MKTIDIPCEVVNDLLPSYADGLTSEKTNALLTAHIDGCAECREKLLKMCGKELTDAAEAEAEIDFLRRNRNRNRKVTVLSILGALFVAAAVLFVKFFVIGSPTASGDANYSLKVDGNTLSLTGSAVEDGRVISFAGVKGNGEGVVEASTRTALKSPLFGDQFSVDYISESEIEKVIVNGKLVFDRSAPEGTISDELRDLIRKNWEEYSALPEMERMFLNTTPGFVYREFATWDEATELFGFEPINPLEEAPELTKKNYAGTSIETIPGKGLMHATVTADGSSAGEVFLAQISSGYSMEGIRIMYSASVKPDGGAVPGRSGLFLGDNEAETVEISFEELPDGDVHFAEQTTVSITYSAENDSDKNKPENADAVNGSEIRVTEQYGRNFDTRTIAFEKNGVEYNIQIVNNVGMDARPDFERVSERVIELVKSALG